MTERLGFNGGNSSHCYTGREENLSAAGFRSDRLLGGLFREEGGRRRRQGRDRDGVHLQRGRPASSYAISCSLWV